MLKNAAARGMMILHLWHVNTSILCWGVVEALDVDLDNMHTVLDACQELKVGLFPKFMYITVMQKIDTIRMLFEMIRCCVQFWTSSLECVI